MSTLNIHAVTGAYGYSGNYITRRLLKKGLRVITLTNSIDKDSDLSRKIETYPLSFDDPDMLTRSLKGVEVLYNTYWVRFDHKSFSHNGAVENTMILFRAAKKAGVKKIVHTSITNPSIDSELDYFRGKAILEKELIESGLSYSILRPAVLFGKEDILMNNIAWIIRNFPFFAVFGNGEYKIQPIFVDDYAELAVDQGQLMENRIIDAIGPETFSYLDLVKSIMDIIGIKKPILKIYPELIYLGSKILGWYLKDITITRKEIKGLMSNLLYTESDPVASTKFTEWAIENRDILGVNYANELFRRKIM